MTPQEYQEAGYKISASMEQAQINQAEEDVLNAYVKPHAGGAVGEQLTPTQQKALMALAFLRISQNNLYVTKSGAKIKNVQESANASMELGLMEHARRCHYYLQEVMKEAEVEDCEFTDICAIYFRTNFFND